jgi:hypothetical protein
MYLVMDRLEVGIVDGWILTIRWAVMEIRIVRGECSVCKAQGRAEHGENRQVWKFAEFGNGRQDDIHRK